MTITKPSNQSKPVCLSGTLLLLTLTLLISAPDVPAQESVRWTDRTGGYDPFHNVALSQEARFVIEHKNDGCDYFVTFSSGRGHGYNRYMKHGRDRLHYLIYKDSNRNNVLKALPQATSAEVYSGTFADQSGNQKQREEFTFYVYIPAEQIVRNGTYYRHRQAGALSENPYRPFPRHPEDAQDRGKHAPGYRSLPGADQ